jgi:hypothetical protein
MRDRSSTAVSAWSSCGRSARPPTGAKTHVSPQVLALTSAFEVHGEDPGSLQGPATLSRFWACKMIVAGM